MFNRYLIHFSRQAGPRPGGRAEHDVNAERVKRFASRHGMVGDLDRILPASAFGILEVSCTPKLAERLTELPEVETILER